MARHRLYGELVFSFQVAPESTESQILPFQVTAASLVPSLEEVMSIHSRVHVEVAALHVREPRAGATAHSVRTRTSDRRDDLRAKCACIVSSVRCVSW